MAEDEPSFSSMKENFMDPDRAVTISTFGDLQEATVAKGKLEEAGIPAALEGKEASVTLWHVGTSLGGVKLMVTARNAERAAQILQELELMRDAADELPPWTCPQCGEEVEGNFEICWSCGEPRIGTVPQPATAGPGGAAPTAPAEGFPSTDEDREAVWRNSTLADENVSTSEDEKADRIWRGTLLGFLLFPLWLFAAWGMLRVSESQLSEAGRRKYNRSFWVLLGVFLTIIGCTAAYIYHQQQRAGQLFLPVQPLPRPVPQLITPAISD